MLCTAQKRSVRALFVAAMQPHSRDIFLNQQILPPDKFINQSQGPTTLAYRVENGTFLLVDILFDRHDHGGMINRWPHQKTSTLDDVTARNGT